MKSSLRVGVVVALAALFAACSKSPPTDRAAAGPGPVPIEPRPLSSRLYDDETQFKRKIPPRPDDWLARFHEPGQTFAQYEASAPIKPTDQRKKLVLQPLGSFGADDQVLLAKLREHLALFFGLDVEARAALAFPPKTKKRSRHEGTHTWVQYETNSIMDDVLKTRIPDDAVVYLGITTADLYPGEDWNFVFGQARFDERVGVYSVARMFESFEGKPETDASRIKGLARSTAILSHETAHAFGMAHCTRFECVMNGTNSLDELDRQFAEPCPVCLHKLTWNIGVDPVKRYEHLRDFYRREHVDALATWMDRRLEQVR